MFDQDDQPVGAPQRLASFSEYSVTTEQNCIVIPPDVDPAVAALVACGVATGVGAALNVANVKPGHVVVIIGFGGVGAAALLGAIVGGAAQVVAADIHDAKQKMALELGATRFVNVRNEDLSTALYDHVGTRGADSVLLTVDSPKEEHFRQGVDLLGPGGVLVQVGLTSGDIQTIPVSPRSLMSMQRSVTATLYGGMDHSRDALKYLELYRAGRLPINRLITKEFSLDQINDAFDALTLGETIRSVIRYD